MDIIDSERVKNVQLSFPSLANDQFRRIVPLFDEPPQMRIHLADPLTGSLQDLAVVIGRVAAGTVTPEQRVNMAVFQGFEQVPQPLLRISASIDENRIAVAIKNQPIRFGGG